MTAVSTIKLVSSFDMLNSVLCTVYFDVKF